MNIPKYINEKGNIFRLIIFTAIFALIFINIYTPFDSNNWYPVSRFMFFLYSSIIIITGVLVLVISRIIMYFYSKKSEITYWNYAFWVLTEILAMSMFYTIYTSIVSPLKDPIDVFKGSITMTSLVILFPYSTVTLYLALMDSKRKLQKLENPDGDIIPLPNSLSFKDEKGIMRLSVQTENLLYIESSDNYAVIYYNNLGKIKKYLIRNTLKNIEKDLEKTSVVRCHRSYLVNFNRVTVMKKTKEGAVLELDVDNTPELPVSKSYKELVTSRFLDHS